MDVPVARGPIDHRGPDDLRIRPAVPELRFTAQICGSRDPVARVHTRTADYDDAPSSLAALRDRETSPRGDACEVDDRIGAIGERADRAGVVAVGYYVADARRRQGDLPRVPYDADDLVTTAGKLLSYLRSRQTCGARDEDPQRSTALSKTRSCFATMTRSSCSAIANS